jgi:HD-like signal output (HDOD) protein
VKRVLFVDDEVQILKSIRRIFPGSSFEVLSADSADSALRIMNDSPVDMIVSDMRMPNMDGIELLNIVKQKYPETIRLILSGYADEEEIMNTLKNNIAKAYMFKPWDNNELLRIVTLNLETNPTLPSEFIAFVNNKNQLPTTNGSYHNIMHTIEENSDLEIISNEIVKDQTISAKVLQVVNSAYYGIKTGSVKKALTILGVNELKNIIMSIDVMECLKTSGPANQIAEKIWAHAYMTSRIQHIFQDRFLLEQDNHVETAAGLLHKIGIVLMLNYYKENYLVYLAKLFGKNDEYLYQTEKQTYGFSHADVSAFLLKWWNMPGQIVEAAARYVSPLGEDVRNKGVCCCVHIAQHYAALILDIGPFCEFVPETFNYLGVDRAVFEEQYRKLI